VSSGGASSPGPGGAAVAWRSAVLRGANDPAITNAPRLRVWQLYWVDGQALTSDARAKLRLAFSRLMGRGDDGAVVLLYTDLPANGQTAEADALLARYAKDHFQALSQSLQAARSAR
jgi:EpsI family protein